MRLITSRKGGTKAAIIILVLIVLIVVVGFAGYYYGTEKGKQVGYELGKQEVASESKSETDAKNRIWWIPLTWFW
jgi:flagellar basal body-associated protein FliL